MAKANKSSKDNNGAMLGFEAKMWQAADMLRNNMDAAEYKHVVLGLIFLKYISDAFEEQHAKLIAEQDQGADPEHPDEYRANRQRSQEDIEHAVRQLVSKAVASEGVIDIFAAAGLKKPDISILSDEFLAEVRDLPQHNLAVEMLRKLLEGEIKTRS